jgi:hypothetical protein
MTAVRRIGGGKDQQGLFTRYDDNGSMILVHVIDPSKGEFIAEAGLLTLKKGDKLYRYTDSFAISPVSVDALQLLRQWPLYIQHPELHSAIEFFVTTAYVPSQILALRERDEMAVLFIPIQQKFRIGRFEEKTDWSRVRKELFRSALDTLRDGEHITYLAQVPQTQSSSPLFYTAGTKPHYETHMCLLAEPYGFNPSHGGHILFEKPESAKKRFIVDAGSQYKGKGVKTPLHVAKEVSDALSRTYPDFEFVPVEGRGAFGTGQSY